MQIYYMRPEWFLKGMLGEEPDPKRLDITHIHLTDIEAPEGVPACLRLEKVWGHMQAENWSPDGEARPLIEAKGLQHTSMSIGDVIVDNGIAHLCVNIGFKSLGPVS